MEFDDKELEKNTDNFSLEEDNSISWEDLLNAQEDDDLSNFVKNADVQEELLILDSVEEEIIEPESKETTEVIFEDVVKDAKEGNEDIILDLDEENQAIEDVEENKNDFYTPDDVLLKDSENDETISETINLQDEVDDELLSILSNDSPAIEFEEKNELDAINEIQDDSFIFDDIKEENSEELIEKENFTEEENESEDTKEEYTYEDNTNKINTSIIAVLVIVFLLGLGTVIYFALNYFGFTDGTNGSDDIMASNNSNYKVEIAIDDTKPIEVEPNKNKIEKPQKPQQPQIKKEEKKVVVVPVVPSGRVNPFLPSSLVDDKGFASYGSDITLPPEVSIDTPEMQAARKLLTISVSGIMYEPNKPSAILRLDGVDYFVQKGDKIDDFNVRQITKEFVSIQNGANVYKAYVGEAFKINKNEITPKNNIEILDDGTRQYVSQS